MKVEDENSNRRVSVAVAEATNDAGLQFFLSQIAAKGYVDVDEGALFRQHVLMPPNSNFMSFWDGFVMLFLAFTAIVTPFEVAFIDTTLTDPLFWINRVVDLFFLTDIFLQFFIPFRDPDTNEWVVDHRRIAKKYLKGWFLIDLVSILPFDVIGVVVQSDEIQKLKALRLIRLLRLLKLIRLARSMRVIARWAPIVPIRYAVTSLIRFGLAMLITCHWVACLLGIIPLIEGSRYEDRTPDEVAADYVPINWQISYFERNLLQPPGSYNIWSVYLAGFYLAAMTLTTIGYGDVVAKTDVERGIMLLVMFVGGGFYAFAIGNVFSIISNMDPLTSEFHDTMDQLNSFMDEVELPRSLRKRVRRYFHFSLYHRRAMNNSELLSYLTPSLKHITAYVVNKAWVDQLPFLNAEMMGEDRQLIVALGDLFKHRACGSNERLFSNGEVIRCVYVVERGAVLLHTTRKVMDGGGVKEIKVSSHLYVQETVEPVVRQELATGTCFGHEALYGVGYDIKATYNATTLTYSELHYIEKEDFLSVLRKHPEVYHRLKTYAVRRELNRSKVVPDTSSAETPIPKIELTDLEREVAQLKAETDRLRKMVSEKTATIKRLVE